MARGRHRTSPHEYSTALASLQVDTPQSAAVQSAIVPPLCAGLDLGRLLGAFVTGTLNVELRDRLVESGLPEAGRAHVVQAKRDGRAWAAWSTSAGPVAVWADYDYQRSEQLRAHVMFVEWWSPRSGYHSLWARCYPKRLTEWIIGRGDPC
jgi:hypothetical protein